jgi:HEPN domain-containing protein
MVDRRLVEEWLAKADEDFGFASSVIEDSPYYAQLCFHYQQAAEKYLKAFIVARELEFRKIHDLLELLNICHIKDASLSEIEGDCIFLRAFYIDTRYPVHWPTSYTKEDVLKARDAAARIQKAIRTAVA